MSIKDLLAELQRDYVATIPGKIINIGSLWESRKLEELETEYHKLKGTGRTYGVPELTQLGEALESICEKQKDALPLAVPISLRILGKIHEVRTSGSPLKLDDDPDFQEVLSLIKNTTPR